MQAPGKKFLDGLLAGIYLGKPQFIQGQLSGDLAGIFFIIGLPLG
jgi:hypothetical protein